MSHIFHILRCFYWGVLFPWIRFPHFILYSTIFYTFFFELADLLTRVPRGSSAFRPFSAMCISPAKLPLRVGPRANLSSSHGRVHRACSKGPTTWAAVGLQRGPYTPESQWKKMLLRQFPRTTMENTFKQTFKTRFDPHGDHLILLEMNRDFSRSNILVKNHRT